MGFYGIFSVVLLVCVVGVFGQTMPTGCTYSKGMYECDYSTTSRPISATSFSNPIAQRIRITNLPSTLNSAIFNANFASMSTASFDTNFAATLELKCASNSAVTISQALFTNMNLFQDVKIINCQVTLNANVFSNLVSVDRIVIENGTIASMNAAAFTGVNITKATSPSPTYPVTTGELLIKNSKVTGNTLPTAMLSGQTTLVSVSLEGLGLTSIDASFFSTNTKLRYISLSRNSLTTIPTTLFDGLDSLAEVQLYETELPCTCAELWFYDRVESTKMKIYGDIICTSPSSYLNKKATVYYYTECITASKSCSDGLFELMGACIMALDLAMYIVTIIAFVVACVVLGLAIQARRKMGSGGAKKGGARGKKLPTKKGAGPKGTKKGWA